jgi:hypothetical protein
MITKKFVKGDILIGKDRSFSGAYHPIVFISGNENTPMAIILTHSKNFPCNISLSGKYKGKKSYFIAHLIEKMSAWGPYKRIGSLTKNDIKLIDANISLLTPITWAQYEGYTNNGCTIHTTKRKRPPISL